MASEETAPKIGRPRVPPISFWCRQCGGEFFMQRSYLTAYRKKWSRDPMYCSMRCMGDAKKLTPEEWGTPKCRICGNDMPIQRRPCGTVNRHKKICSSACRSLMRKKLAAERFEENGGANSRHKKRHGYMWISIPALANPTGKKISMLEHRYVMQQCLGRDLLKEETVHHRDGNRQNNSIENLELFSSRHGPGQRVRDKVAFAIEMLRTYPEFAAEQGYRLEPTNGAGEGHALTPPSDLGETR